MNDFQPINNGDTGLEARAKINNLGTTALGLEHNASASAHPTFVSPGHSGSKSSGNPYSAEQTTNLGDQLAMNLYGNNGTTFGTMRYVGAQILSASNLKQIITQYGGSDSSMPSYWGVTLENSGTYMTDPSYFYHAGFFVFSRNEESNNSAYPHKVLLFSGKDGVKKAYFKNGTSPALSAWQAVGGGEPANVPLATTSTAGIVTLAGNTGNSTDGGKVPVCSAGGKLSPNLIAQAQPTVYGLIQTAYGDGRAGESGKAVVLNMYSKLPEGVLPDWVLALKPA